MTGSPLGRDDDGARTHPEGQRGSRRLAGEPAKVRARASSWRSASGPPFSTSILRVRPRLWSSARTCSTKCSTTYRPRSAGGRHPPAAPRQPRRRTSACARRDGPRQPDGPRCGSSGRTVSGGHGRVDAVTHGELGAPAQDRGRAGGDPDAGRADGHGGSFVRGGGRDVAGRSARGLPAPQCHHRGRALKAAPTTSNQAVPARRPPTTSVK